MSYKDIARLIPTIQSVNLVKENMKKKKKKKSDDMIKMGMKNIVGVNLIKINSDLVEGL